VIYVSLTEYIPRYDDAHAFAKKLLESTLGSLTSPEYVEQVWLLTNDEKITRLRCAPGDSSPLCNDQFEWNGWLAVGRRAPPILHAIVRC
jgi:hypothetical protein